MNPYHVLGVNSRASDEEISRAYKALARRYHPDLNPGSAAAERRMRDINLAYSQIKTMRQSGTEPPPERSRRRVHPDRGYARYYKKEKIDIMWPILGILAMLLLVRLVLSLLYGTYRAPCYVPEGMAKPAASYYIVPQ